MNLQSNALKFTREGGSIRIITEFVISKCKGVFSSFYRYRDDFNDSNDSDSKSNDSNISDYNKFEHEHGIN